MQEWAKGEPNNFSQPHRVLQSWICSSHCPGWGPEAGPPFSQGSSYRQLCSAGAVVVIESITIIQGLLHVGHCCSNWECSSEEVRGREQTSGKAEKQTGLAE